MKQAIIVNGGVELETAMDGTIIIGVDNAFHCSICMEAQENTINFDGATICLDCVEEAKNYYHTHLIPHDSPLHPDPINDCPGCEELSDLHTCTEEQDEEEGQEREERALHRDIRNGTFR